MGKAHIKILRSCPGTKSPELARLHERIFDISYEHKLSHLGSCITAVGIIDDIYKNKAKNDTFILSCGHAGLALYVIIEKYLGINADWLLRNHGVHPCFDPKNGIHCSSGSLGMGLSVAVGMAMAQNGKIYCLISDGECAEGVVYESLNAIKKFNLRNIKVYVNANGYSAYDHSPDLDFIESYPSFITPVYTSFEPYKFLNDLDAHYHVLTKEDYEQAKAICRSSI